MKIYSVKERKETSPYTLESNWDGVYNSALESLSQKTDFKVSGQHESIDIEFSLRVANLAVYATLNEAGDIVDRLEFSGTTKGTYLVGRHLFDGYFTDGDDVIKMIIKDQLVEV